MMKKNTFILILLIFSLFFTSAVKVCGQVNKSSQTDIVQLLSGWNLISLDVIPVDNTPASIFASLISENKLLYVSGFQNQEGVFFDPYGPDFLNTLLNMNPGEGYWVKVNTACSLVVSGDPIPETLSIDLASGWNLVGYWLKEPMAPKDAFAELITLGNLVYVSGFVNQEGVFFDPYGPDFLNTLDTLRNGYGYWVKMSTAHPDFTFPGTSTTWQCGNPITDFRDGQTYETVQIGEQCWMKENLNYSTEGSVCYDDNSANCDTYGRLYSGNIALTACQSGWHLPTDSEWTMLTSYLGGDDVAGGKMKESGTTHWQSPNTGATNESGFTALPGGFLTWIQTWSDLGTIGLFWSSTTNTSTFNEMWMRHMNFNGTNVYRNSYPAGYRFSVRCLKDETATSQLEVTPSNQDVGSESGTTSFEVTSNTSWTVEESVEWLSVTPMSGSSNETLTVTYNANPSGDLRVGQITVTADGGNPVENVMVTQSGPPQFSCGQSFIDTRDGQTYETVQFGTQCWMKENLNIGTMITGGYNQTDNDIIEKYCYNNDPANCEVYGGLYQWNEIMQNATTEGAQGICPTGWHLPTDGEWCTLTTWLDATVNCNSSGWSGTDAGGKMKETGTTHWASPNTGATNSSGFLGLPGGWRSPDSFFYDQAISGFWWSSSQYGESNSWARYLGYNVATVNRGGGDLKWNGLSVRCLKDENSSTQLEVTPTNQDVTAVAGSTSFEVTSNTSWTVEESVEWLSVTPLSGTNNGTITVNYDANPSGDPREGLITITAEGGIPVVNVTVTQAGSLIFICGQSFTDTRDGQSYETVQIGTQCWMKENLNVGTMINGGNNQTDNGIIEKYCYNNDPANCDVYGGLYQWHEMMDYSTIEGVQGICPTGWHLPDEIDWATLSTSLGGDGGALKEIGTTHWVAPNGGATNSSGFTALPAGVRFFTDFSFYDLGTNAYFWSSSQGDASGAWTWHLYYGNAGIGHNNWIKSYGFSVRCLKDETSTSQLEVTPTNQNVTGEAGSTTFEVTSNTSWTIEESVDWFSVTPVSGNNNETLTVTYDANPTGDSRDGQITITANGGNPVVNVTVTQTGSIQFTCGQSFIDTRDGQSYETVQIGTQCWMKENLNVGTMINGGNNQTDNEIFEKYCYNNDPANCEVYGGLYQWDEMMDYATTPGVQGICPSVGGWHLPTDVDWIALTTYLGGENLSGGKMKSTGTVQEGTGLWNSPNMDATNSSGFSAIPGGYRSTDGSYGGKSSYGLWWSTFHGYSSSALIRECGYDFTYLYQGYDTKFAGFSVRCLKDLENTPPATPSNPSPENGALNKPVNLSLSWSCSDPDNDPLTYDVCLGTFPDPQLVVTGIPENSYTPGALENFTTYNWKIVAHDDHDHTTEGTVWSFTTSDQIWQCGSPFTDTRDGQTYETVQIGTQCWMKENLNVGTMINGGNNQTDNEIFEKYCYNNDLANCEVYGGLYQWDEMMDYATTPGVQGICPSVGGWHLPTDVDWIALTTYLGGENLSGGKMKSTGTVQEGTGLWNSPNMDATNSSGFSAAPGGYRSTDGSYGGKSNYGLWWSTFHGNSSSALIRECGYDFTYLYQGYDTKSAGFSVRCIKDETSSSQLEVTPTNQNVTYEAGTTTFEVISNTSWTVEESVEWLSVTPMSGSSNETLTVTYNANPSGDTRVGQITITADGGDPVVNVTLTQSGSLQFTCGQSFTDTRDGQSYETVQIGEQCWMKENLNVGNRTEGINNQTNNGTIEKYCYYDLESSCDISGGLYQWDEAMQYNTTPGVQGICPSDWHIPTDEEWLNLTNYVSSQPEYLCNNIYSNNGKALASKMNWSVSYNTCAVGNNPAINNATDFGGYPGGRRLASGGFNNYGQTCHWWSSTMSYSQSPWIRTLSYTSWELIKYDQWGSNLGFSVRCLKDN